MSVSIQTQPTAALPYSVLLRRRLKGPQRHRLLQGYPMPPLMVEYDRNQPYEPVTLDSARPLIVGVLPHASCNPSVKGCGYCTFPHEEFRVSAVRETVRAVAREVRRTKLGERRVEALYLGGGTANLTPPDVFSELCRVLDATFDLTGSEVTLEGAPVFFTSQKEALLNSLAEELSCSEARLSMGVQTFDKKLLALMGRESIGHPQAVQKAVLAARKRGMTTSADLMINMPQQTLKQMKSDIRHASDLGFSQICIYHLVLFRGLGTPWAKNHDMLKALPPNKRAFQNWREVVELAKSLGYVQKTLTNFEREGHYRYEECSYQPALFDGVGFGPEALSCFTDPQIRTAVKWMNESSSGDYKGAMGRDGQARARVFVYGGPDLKLLFLTRSLPSLKASRTKYREVFGTDMVDDFREPLEALRQERLVEWDVHNLTLTERGMFYADSVAGLLAHDRVGELRRGLCSSMNDAPVFRMG